jgi:hypothetical protein
MFIPPVFCVWLPHCANQPVRWLCPSDTEGQTAAVVVTRNAEIIAPGEHVPDHGAHAVEAGDWLVVFVADAHPVVGAGAAQHGEKADLIELPGIEAAAPDLLQVFGFFVEIGVVPARQSSLYRAISQGRFPGERPWRPPALQAVPGRMSPFSIPDCQSARTSSGVMAGLSR